MNKSKPTKTLYKMSSLSLEYDATNYKHKKPIQHIRDIPDTYLGSAKQIPRKTLIYDFDTNKITYKTIKTPVAFERLFVEAFSNAIDNNTRSKNRKINPGSIDITITDKLISVCNGGIVIPLSQTEFYVDNTSEPVKCYVAEMIFGHLLTGSNYTHEREGNGRNGYGVKLVNIFSTQFKVKITYQEKSMVYEQEWSNGMLEKTEPYIYTSKQPLKNSVCVSYIPDFERFEKKNINLEDVGLLLKHIYDGALTTKDDINVKINHPDLSSSINLSLSKFSLKDYTKLRYSQQQADTAVYITNKAVLKHTNKPVEYELAVIDNPNIGEQLKDMIVDHNTFINGINTYRGGVHLDACLDELFPAMITATGLNETTSKSTNTTKSSTTKTTERKVKITPVNIRTHLSIILSVYAPSPEFSSQLKDALTSPEMTFKFKPTEFLGIRKWLMMDTLKDIINSKNLSLFQKSDGKRKTRVDLPVDAYYAGTKTGKKQPTILFGVEGQSAGQFITALIDNLPGKADYHGCFHFRGKPINAYGCKLERLAANKEYQRLKEALGLKEGIDYTDKEQQKTLRYDHFVITPDADLDGKHITMLILGMIVKRWPSLLKIRYISLLRTPVVRVFSKSKQGKSMNFFSQEEFEQWRQSKIGVSVDVDVDSDGDNSEDGDDDQNDSEGKHQKKPTKQKKLSGYIIKYCKGLGSSSKKEIKEDYKSEQPRYISFLYNDKDPEQKDNLSFRLALHPDETHSRKKWIQDWVKKSDLIIEEFDELPVSMFINEDFIQYSIANVIRCIPSGLDGLKPSQRKVLYGLMLNYKPVKPKTMVEFVDIKSDDVDMDVKSETSYKIKFTGNVVKQSKKTIKTDALSTYVAHHTNYHHGSVILQSVICMMGAEFTGSNNIPYLIPDSMMGSRRGGGKDMAAARYTSSYPHPILNYIYKYADLELTGFTCDDDKKGEFNRALPIIPLHVINGVNGIGTGVSTFIPNHHPLEVVDWLVQRNRKEMGLDYSMPIINPWYCGFKGNIYINKRMKKRNKPKGAVPKQFVEAKMKVKDEDYYETEDVDADVDYSEEGDVKEDVKIEDLQAIDNTLDNHLDSDDENDDVKEQKEASKNHDKYKDNNSEDDDILEQELNLDDSGFVHPDETLPSNCRVSMVSTGIYYKTDNGDIQIEELPIGLWGNKYKTLLEELRKKKKIKNYKDQDTDEGIKWLLLDPEFTPNSKNLYLKRSYTMNNMVLLSEDNKPKKFNNIYEILEDYYITRLSYYKKRKDTVLSDMKASLEDISEYIRFLQLYIDDQIVFKVGNKPLKVKEIYEQLDKHKINYKYYNNGQIRHFNEEKIHELRNIYNNTKSNITKLENYHVCNIWIDELKEFEEAYTEMFGDKYDISRRKYDYVRSKGIEIGTIKSVRLSHIQKRREKRSVKA